MPRQAKPKPADLTINANVAPASTRGNATPDPKSSPMNLQGIDLSSFGGDIGMDIESLPPLPQSPPIPPSPGLHKREHSASGTNGVKSRTKSEAETRDQRSLRQVKDDEDFRPSSSSMSKIYHLRKNPGSTPELSLVGSKENARKQSNEGSIAPTDIRPQPSPHRSEDGVSVRRKDKNLRNPLARSKSIRRDSHSKTKPNGIPTFDQPPKTAPLASNGQAALDMGFFKGKGHDRRGKSAERAAASESDENAAPASRAGNNNGRSFVSGSKNVMSKAVSGGGSLFSRLGKVGRSGSSTAKEIPDNEYVSRVINLPLVEQTRATRISKDLDGCRDKTEFWMPALPWRCIDYLNQNCESEGLYRVPGSGPQVKHWQRRFDTELDINLLDERELYDPNNIGSMLKSWLRELPSEIMPKQLQQSLAAELAAGNRDYQKPNQPVPQKLRDALSHLPPFNYYLLFAITCHLSLLLSHTDKNKMDIHNLSICIGPCLELERWLFGFLVGDWRNCWQGCFTEKEYLAAEKAHHEGREYVVPQMPTIADQQARAQTQEPEHDQYEDDEDESLEVGNEDRILHSSGTGRTSDHSRGASTQGSRYEDARSAPHSPQRATATENTRPDVFQTPRASSKYAVGSGSTSNPNGRQMTNMEQHRPHTAGKQSESNSSSAAATPRQPHSRSQSEYQLSPVKPSSPVDFPFSFRES